MPSQAEIENIIRVVVERLRGVAAAQIVEQSSHQTQLVARNNEPQVDSAATLKLERSLVTLENLRDSLSGIRVVQVSERAVVTPAVKDELRARGIELQRIASPNAAAMGDSHHVLIIASPAKQAAMPRRAVAESTIDESLAKLTAHTSTDKRLAIWWSGQPFAAIAATKPIANLRAVQLGALGDLQSAMEQACPNVLILDERQWTAASVSNLARLCTGLTP